LNVLTAEEACPQGGCSASLEKTFVENFGLSRISLELEPEQTAAF
jgi:hypothetical protein